VQRLLIFDVNDLKELIIHYTDGKLIPLSSEVVEVGVSKYLQRIISLNITSKDWPDHDIVAATGELTPYEFSYEGRRTMSWTNRHDENVTWADGNETPKRQ